MQRLALFIGALTIALAAALSYLGGNLVADYVETSTTTDLRDALVADGFDWVAVRADGLIVHVSGPAPTEAARFGAMTLIKGLVNASRVEDGFTVVNPGDLQPPKFSLELLRNNGGVSLIGLIPTKTGRDSVLKSISGIGTKSDVTDMLETADYPIPKGWPAALKYALGSLRALPLSKISVTPQEVTIKAITGSPAEKARVTGMLEKSRPKGLKLILNILAPRPVITPFSLRFIKDASGVRFDSCSADTVAARKTILAAAKKAGLVGAPNCTIGLGTPSPRWGAAAAEAIAAVNQLGGGTLTFSDADITLVAKVGTKQTDFDRVIYNLEQALPDVFSVHAVLPPKPVAKGAVAKVEPPEFIVTKSPEGMVQMRGRLRTALIKLSVHNFATALFGAKNVHDTTRLDPTLPDGWPKRIMVGLESLNQLHNGMLTVTPDTVTLSGIADRPQARTEVTQILSSKLGDSARFKINVTYVAALNRKKVPPTPQQCVDKINGILKQQQITFEPASSNIDSKSIAVVEKIATAMQNCQGARMEIGGYTDSQGRAAMNQALSQARAESVLDALLGLDVLTTNLSAKGYGASHPIANNNTAAGRQANRRITFKLLNGGTTKTVTAKTPPADATAKPGKDAKKSETHNGKN